MDDVDAGRWVQGRVDLLLEELEVVGLALDPAAAADLIDRVVRSLGSEPGCSEEEARTQLDDATVLDLAHTVGTVLAAEQPVPDPDTARLLDTGEVGRLVNDLTQVATLGLTVEHHLARQALSLLAQLADQLRGCPGTDIRIPGDLLRRHGLVVHAAVRKLEGERPPQGLADQRPPHLRLVQENDQ